MKQCLLLAFRQNSFPTVHYLAKQAAQHAFLFCRHGAWLLTVVFVMFSAPGAWAQDILAQDILAGLTSAGGLSGEGTAFTIKSDGTNFTVRKTFARSGQKPYGNLIKALDGNFYGMNSAGGTFGYGNIFKMSAAGKVTNLHSFNSETYTGIHPRGSLVQGTDGNLYGMTSSGGLVNYGTIFKITPGGTVTVLHHLKLNSDGGQPYGNLVRGSTGNFYGLTSAGGTYGGGTIFKITPGGTYTVVRHLDRTNDGGNPRGSLVLGADGNFYGMTYNGGTHNAGTIFRITPGGIFSVRRHLNYTTDGGNANGNSLIQASDGNFYGMLFRGGSFGFGTIFKLALGGTYTVVRHLDRANDGGNPRGSLVQNSDGNFYGMTYSGGTYNAGTIFKITPGGTYTVLKNLRAVSYGSNPQGSLVRNSSDGNFYGTTALGGPGNGGTIFKITPDGTYTLLVPLPESSGAQPYGSLMQARDGFFYGMTSQGGKNDDGSIFKFCGSSFSVIQSFDELTSGSFPQGNLVQGTDGNFYGMTTYGGVYSHGTIFKMTPNGTITVLWNLDYTIDGGSPSGSLVQGADGNFYGMTKEGGKHQSGTIFKITPDGILTVLHNFSGYNGARPHGSLIQARNGYFYGLTSGGGSYGGGTIFRISPSGTYTVLRHLGGTGNDGRHPVSSLVQGADGNFYGTTTASGTFGEGTIFKITPGGTFTVLRSLSVNDGSRKTRGLVQGSNGSLYGLSNGDDFGYGTIFKMTTSGTFTVLRHLNSATDGRAPGGSLVVQKANPVANAQSVTTAVNTPKTITLTGSGGTPLTYTVVSQPQHGTLTGSGANRTYTPDAGFTGNDAFTYHVTWGCQQSSTKTVAITVTGNATSEIRLNSGGPAVSTSLGSFSADTYFTGATSVSTTTSLIANTTNDALYQDNRRATTADGSFQYNIPVSNGSYTVRLHFAEIYYSVAGQRKFNVTAEGVSWLTNYDIYGAAGGAKKAIVATKTINVLDGTLNLNFISTVDKACVSAIEILPVAGAERLATEEEPPAESALATSIYPNPVKTLLMVQLSAPTNNVQTSVRDATGAEVMHNLHQVVGNDKLQINVVSLPAGLYLLQLETYQGRQTFKFMKE